MAAARRRHLRPTALATLLLAVLVVPPVAAKPAAPVAPAVPTATAAPEGDEDVSTVTITSITPFVGEGEEAVIEGYVTNTSGETLSAPHIAVAPQTASGVDPEEWARGSDPVSGTALAETTMEDIPAGGQTDFALAVDGDQLLPGTSAGAAPVSVQTSDTAVHTFVGIHRSKEYVPLEVVWGVPLLLPAERELFGRLGEDRTQDWQDAVGQDSRLSRLTEDPPEEDEAWLLDPSLLQVPEEIPDGTPQDARDDAADEQEVRQARATDLRETLVGDRTIVLPDSGADVAAGAESDRAGELVAPRVEEGRDVAADLDAHGNVLWPIDGLVTKERTRGYDRLHPGNQPPTVLVPEISVEPDGFTPTGSGRTTDGTPLLVRDSQISQLVSGLRSTTNNTLARQRLIAETSALLRERPGTERTLFIVPDRHSTPSAGAYERLRDNAEDIPWLTSGRLPDLMAEAEQAEPVQKPRTDSQIAYFGGESQRPLLTAWRARKIESDENSMATFASVRSDGTTWRRYVESGLHQLTSARWRGDEHDFLLLHDALSTEVRLSEEDIVVSSGDVNFFADSGRLQITVINNTDVELTHLRVRLSPGGPFLRIEGSPEPLTIGPNGRRTVNVRASALAAGQIPVHVNVLSPGGRVLTDQATLDVTVRPTGNLVYWVIGGAAVLLLVGGTWRTVRGGRRAKGASVTDTEGP